MILRGSLKKKIPRFIGAKCHIKLNHAIYIYYDIYMDTYKT